MQTNQTVVIWLGKSGLLVALAAGIGWTWGQLQTLRAEVIEQRQRLEEAPREAAKVAMLKNELAKRQFDVERITAFLVERNELADAVGEIEAAAERAGVEVTVPGVAEREIFDEDGNVVEPSGPILEVELDVVALGPPRALLAFLHSIEHTQRLTYLASWRLDATERAARGQQTEESAEPRGVLTVDYVVAVRR